MRVRVTILLALLGLVSAASVSAQESLVEYVQNACGPELKNFCSTVTPGQGRIMLCFAAHEDQLSERCEYALYQASAALEQAVAAIGYVGRACRSDIQTLCPEATPGDGRILECLDSQAEKVSQVCKDAVSDVVD